MWMGVALLIDGIDGTFARLFRVNEVLPNFSGKTIDYVIDFFTFAILPAFFIYETHLLPKSVEPLGIAMVLLVSAIYYGKEGMVSAGNHFVGFPVMWNALVIFLFFVVQSGDWANFGAVVFFSILHFVPILYPYPSRTLRFMGLNIVATVLFFVSLGMVIYQYPQPDYTVWHYLAMGTVLYYGAVSGVYTWENYRERGSEVVG